MSEHENPLMGFVGPGDMDGPVERNLVACDRGED